MQRGVAILLSLTVTACFTGTVFGQANKIFFTMDPTKNVPTMITETGPAKKIVFYSADFIDPLAAPVPFTLVFKDTFAGQYDATGPNETNPVMRNNGDITFESSLTLNGVACNYDPPGPGAPRACHWVKMKLANAPGAADSGFLYQVEMGAWGQVIDPRIRGR